MQTNPLIAPSSFISKLGSKCQWFQGLWNALITGKRRLLTMSCSDKLARINVVGIQGALLSLMFQPIYLASVIIGQDSNPVFDFSYLFGYENWALRLRYLGSLRKLPESYRCNKTYCYVSLLNGRK
jgi:hypothetical protein